MQKTYNENGYFVLKNFFNEEEIKELTTVLNSFHNSWKTKNKTFYDEKAINSAYITGREHLNDHNRAKLFNFIASIKLMNVATSVLSRRPTFMNTQLFFNPVTQSQKNYWHRDPQYHLKVDEQKSALKGPDVVHFRIPLFKEFGIELVPGTHKRWDNSEEQDVRLECNGHKNNDNLSSGKIIALEAGDLMVFSANMIHRGIYGLERLSLDIILCEPEQSLVAFVKDDCLPEPEIMRNLENADAFMSTIELRNKSPSF